MSEALRISLVMIVKNEERFIKQCLRSVEGFVSEIIVADTGSTDRTKAIASSLGATVFDVQWNDDFAAARNAALDRATGDIILHLDADEELEACSAEILKTELTDGALAYTLHVVDNRTGASSIAVRMFRASPHTRYLGRIHEQPALKSDHGFNGKITYTKARIIHHGYASDILDSKSKLERNRQILEKMLAEDPYDELTLYYLAVTYSSEGNVEKAAATLFPQFKRAGSLKFSYVARYLVELLFELKRSNECLEILETSLKDFPSYTDLHYLKGMVLNSLDRPTEAAAAFKRCVEIGKAPDMYNTRRFIESAYPLFQLALLASTSPDPKSAVQYFEAALLAKPADKQIADTYRRFQEMLKDLRSS